MTDELATQDIPGTGAMTRTGHEAVDAVLGSLDGLDDAEVATHVAVFERAHERLRGALDAPQT